MAKKFHIVNYAKGSSQKDDAWARLKMWKDPAGGNARASNPLAGNNPMNGTKGKAMKPTKRLGMDAPDGFDGPRSTYGNLNKPGDSTA